MLTKLSLVAAILACVLAKIQTPEEFALHQTCVKTSQVNPELFTKAYNNREISPDGAFKQYILCMAKKVGYIKEDNKFDLDIFRKRVAQKVPDEKLQEKLIQLCAITKENELETAYQSVVCFFKNTPETVKFDVSYDGKA